MKTSSIIHLKADSAGPAIDSIERQTGLSHLFLQSLADLGAIYINHQRIQGSVELFNDVDAGEYLRIHPNPKRFSVELFDPVKSILFEDQDLIVLNKPSGLPVHPTLDNKVENLLNLASTQLRQKLFITHRLDVGTSGAIIFAKSVEAQKKINVYFAENKVHKIYRAWTHGTFKGTQELVHYMRPSDRAPKTLSSNPIYGWLHCKLTILDAFETDPYHSELTIRLHTGRTHQIRSQLAAVGHPVVGDTMYGSHTRISGLADHWALQCSYLAIPLLSEFENRNLVSEDQIECLCIKVPQAEWH